MTRNKFLLLLITYCFFLIALFLYSFTQVDLNLTISQNNLLFSFQKFFQYIGYFNRPLSTGLFISTVLIFFIFYFLFFILASKKSITLNQITLLVMVTTILLVLSYPAYSHDLFNYIFDVRIFTKYGLNPYLYKALDFPTDPWIRFMHWTHRTYPYGPSWLLITTPFSYLGLGKFIPTLILFKSIMAISFLTSSFLIYKIAQKIKLGNPLQILVLFSLNPLVIIESLTSAHHEIVMIAFALGAFYLLLNNKYLFSIILLVLSALIKYVTAVLILVWIIVLIYKINKRNFLVNKILLITCTLLLVTLLFYLKDHTLQPWYFLWFLPFVLLLNNKYLNIMNIFFSFGLLLTYAPYLYLGSWDNPAILIKTWTYSVLLLLGLFVSGIIFLQNYHKK